MERASSALRGGSDRPDSHEGGAFADVEVGFHRGTSDRSAGVPLMDEGATAIGRPSTLTQDREDSFEPGRDLVVPVGFDGRRGWVRRSRSGRPVGSLGGGARSGEIKFGEKDGPVGGHVSRGDASSARRGGRRASPEPVANRSLGGLRGYRAFRSAGFADAVACSAWRPRSLGASSRIRIGKGFPIADDPRPPTDSLARVERVERRSTAFRPSRPEPPPTMTIQVPSFSVGRRRAGAFSPAAVESGGDGC